MVRVSFIHIHFLQQHYHDVNPAVKIQTLTPLASLGFSSTLNNLFFEDRVVPLITPHTFEL